MNPNTAALWQVIIAALNLFVLIVTLTTLILYTKYTYKMQRSVERQVKVAADQTNELIHQRRLSILPAFVIYPLFSPAQNSFLHIKNIGNGVAINIQVEDVHLNLEEYPGTSIGFNKLASLLSTQEETLSPRFQDFGSMAETNAALRNPRVSDYLRNEAFTMIIGFYDVEGNAYTQRVQMDKGRCTPSPVELVVT